MSQKTTKNDDRMAFFKLEDKFGELECIVFPKKYNEFYHDIFIDGAVYVEGTVSIKDDESPKILVNLLTALIENDRYVGKPQVTSQQKANREQVAISATPQQETQNSGVAPSMINMYLSLYGMAQNNAIEQNEQIRATSEPIEPRATAPRQIPQKLYLRLPDMTGEIFQKAKNMVDIFNEGTVKVIFYDSSTAKYSEYSERMFYSDYAIKELKRIIGEENVVLK